MLNDLQTGRRGRRLAKTTPAGQNRHGRSFGLRNCRNQTKQRQSQASKLPSRPEEHCRGGGRCESNREKADPPSANPPPAPYKLSVSQQVEPPRRTGPGHGDRPGADERGDKADSRSDYLFDQLRTWQQPEKKKKMSGAGDHRWLLFVLWFEKIGRYVIRDGKGWKGTGGLRANWNVRATSKKTTVSFRLAGVCPRTRHSTWREMK